MKKFYKVKYIVEFIDERKSIPCDNCNGTGRIPLKVFDKYLNKEIDIPYACPKCDGTSILFTDNSGYYKDKIFLECGSATLKTKDGKDINYLLGYKGLGTLEETEKALEENLNLYGASDFSLLPQFLDWLMVGENQVIFDTLDEALEEIKKIEKNGE